MVRKIANQHYTLKILLVGYIHSSGMMLGSRLNFLSKFSPVIFYALFIDAWSILFKNWVLPLFFIISLVAKAFGKSTHDRRSTIILTIWFLASVLITEYASSYITKIFPFSEEVFKYKRPNSSGSFVEQPQTLLVWGIIYFSIVAIIEVILYWKKGMPEIIIHSNKNA